eukprot:CAMPEP_0177762440 /NCGR_PEP_ID=MMETSP0491_2-20121128/6346_1 /TAXON_ID=63592 /ORGANISM="Tetraselmis chuii, Strain PLY429" /LENGTH=376 /DNA_ID=CAMNT_0019278495 /DNA_START=286 /DNA_END=1416 /DNA_ORIENTATION=+
MSSPCVSKPLSRARSAVPNPSGGVSRKYCLSAVPDLSEGNGVCAEGRRVLAPASLDDTSSTPAKLQPASRNGKLSTSTSNTQACHTAMFPRDIFRKVDSEPRLPRNSSLQFDFEIEEDPESAGILSEERARLQQAAIKQLQSLLELRTPEEAQLNDAIVEAKVNAEVSGQPLTSDSLAVVLEDLGHSVCVRKAIGGGSGLDCLQNLKHRFLLVQTSFGRSPLIIDIEFRAQFEVAHATPLYQALLDNMGCEFIGNEAKLRRALQFLCDEMATAFHEQGVQLPPWRRARALLSKWCPRRSEDSSPSEEQRKQTCGMELMVKRSAMSEPIMLQRTSTGFLPAITHSKGGPHQSNTSSFPIWTAGGASDVPLPWAAHAN